MDQGFGKDSDLDGSDLGAVVQRSQVVGSARTAAGASFSLHHLGVSPCGLMCS